MSEVPICVGLKPDVEGNPLRFFKVAASLCSPLRPVMKTQAGGAMQYKRLEITAFEQEPGKWRARIVAANGRPLKDDDRQLRQLLESVTGATAVDALTLAMEAVDAAGLFFRNADREIERFWRGLRRASETSGRAYPLSKKKPRRRHVLSNFIRRELWLDNLLRAHRAPDTEITK